MKIIITAGGTSEPIDDVRKITNTSTGSLGLEIGKAFLGKYRSSVDKLYYLHGEKAAYPEDELVTPITIGGTIDLQTKLTDVLESDKIDAVIHAMAVSDYMVGEVTTRSAIANGQPSPIDPSKKISSHIDDLVICLTRTPKVISGIKKVSPDTRLVGFKLLSNVPHEELMAVAKGVMDTNDCEFVLANDLSEIGNGKHRGYLLHRDGTYDTMETKAEIADMIAKRLTQPQSAADCEE